MQQETKSLPVTRSYLSSEGYRLPYMTQERAAEVPTESKTQKKDSVYIAIFIIFQFACQVALLSEMFSSLRVYMRTASFASSLVLLIIVPRKRGRKYHPATKIVTWTFLLLLLSLFHPTTNSLLAGSAQIVLYLAIFGPLFWVSSMEIGRDELRKVLLIIFIFNAASAGVGALQIYFPGSYQPTLSTAYANMDEGYVEDLKITLSSGERVYRPMGLTDTPGGASVAGFFTVLLGVGFYVTTRKIILRILYPILITIGLTCLYLTQVRSWLIITVLGVLTLCALLAWQKQMSRLFAVLRMLAVAIFLSLTIAMAAAGESVINRLTTLIEDRPETVYYSNRGIFLEDTINNLLPLYPYGAGLGRWGMMNTYFGDNTDPERAQIYVEIQLTGWLLDGGLLLVIANVLALLVAARIAWIISIDRGIGEIAIWGAIVLAYNIGAIATIFGSSMFIGQGGMQFWLLNAVLFASARTEPTKLSLFKRVHA